MVTQIKQNSLYNRLVWRNRFITIMRFLVPLVGLIILSLLVIKIYIANIGNDYNISNIRIERDLIILETPQYSGTMGNGSKYKITAQKATTAVGDGDVFDLSDAEFDMTGLDDLSIIATAKKANYDIVGQVVKVKDEMIVHDSRGMNSKLNNVIIDWETQILNAKDSAEIVFSDGSTLNSKTLIYDINAQTYKFTQVTLIIKKEE